MPAVAARSSHRKIGALLLGTGLFGALIALLGMINPAAAASAGFNVTGSVSFSPSANRTTAHFTFSGTKEPSDIRVLPCNAADATSSGGPSGTKSSPTGFGGSGQTGVKFQPGAFGAYTVVFSGHVFRVDVVIVSGHQHTVFGIGNATCAPGPIPTSTTSTTRPPTTTSVTVSAHPPIGGEAVHGFPDGIRPVPAHAAVVAGARVARGAVTPANVEPAVAGTALAHTGKHTRSLLLAAGLALVLGGVAVMSGDSRRAAAVD